MSHSSTGMSGELLLDGEKLRLALDTMDMGIFIDRVLLDCEHLHLQPTVVPFRVKVYGIRFNLCQHCRDNLLAERYPLPRNNQ